VGPASSPKRISIQHFGWALERFRHGQILNRQLNETESCDRRPPASPSSFRQFAPATDSQARSAATRKPFQVATPYIFIFSRLRLFQQLQCCRIAGELLFRNRSSCEFGIMHVIAVAA